MTRYTDMLTTLRTLDPAEPNIDPHDVRARATLERVLATEPDRSRATLRRRRGRRLAVLAAATAVTAGTAVVIVPSLMNGDRAFATWTAAPSGLSTQNAVDAAENCRDAHFDGPASGDLGAEYRDDLRGAAIAIAERRGEWTLVTLAGSDGFSALCITDESTPLFRDWIGSIGTPAGYVAPGPRHIVATDLGAGSVGAGELSVAAGYVGTDVVDVTYRSVAHGDVEATVSGGRFALWLPGDELEGASRDGVELLVTYQDGSSGTVRVDLQ